MKNRKGVYWPIVLIAPLAVVAWIHAWSSAVDSMPLGADRLTAELARAVSYGLVGGDTGARAPKAVHRGARVPPSQAT